MKMSAIENQLHCVKNYYLAIQERNNNLTLVHLPLRINKKNHENARIFHDPRKQGFSMSGNPFVASDLLLGGHVTGYGRHFENINSARHKYRF